jgi:putative phosphoesterase
MIKIGLLSDTHSHLSDDILPFFADCQEIWHAGDIGSEEIADKLEAYKPLRAVYGNIDGRALRLRYPEFLRFTVEGLDVLMTHIGGYPGKYPKKIKELLMQNPPNLFICGHSHILKIMPDAALNLLHINPGACGIEGWHKVKTALRFDVEAGKIKNLELSEWKLRI